MTAIIPGWKIMVTWFEMLSRAHCFHCEGRLSERHNRNVLSPQGLCGHLFWEYRKGYSGMDRVFRLVSCPWYRESWRRWDTGSGQWPNYRRWMILSPNLDPSILRAGSTLDAQLAPHLVGKWAMGLIGKTIDPSCNSRLKYAT